MKIADVVILDRKRPLRDVSALAQSIKEVGLMQPIVVTQDRVLVAGLHRLEACKRLGWEEIPHRTVKLDDLRRELGEIDENLVRHELYELQKSQQLKRRKEIYEALHPETVHGATPGNQHSGKIRSPDLTKTPSFLDATAAVTGEGRSTIAESVQIATNIAPEVQERLQSTPIADNKTELLKIARIKDPAEQARVVEKIATGEAKSIRDVKRIDAKTDVQEAAKLSGKYRVIYADPPWKYGDSGYGHGPAEFHYPTMSIEDLCALPVRDLALDDAVLFMWTTSPLLEETFDVINAWGFKYKASFVWDKVAHNVGHYVSVRHEFLLICTRGSCTPDDRRLIDSVQSIERGEHSDKPEQFRAYIDQMYPLGKRIELFARRAADGWERWGNQS